MSILEWFMVITGPIVMPFIGIFIIVFGVRTYVAKQNGERNKALKNKAMFIGLGQWAYRVGATFACIGLLVFGMLKLDRFG